MTLLEALGQFLPRGLIALLVVKRWRAILRARRKELYSYRIFEVRQQFRKPFKDFFFLRSKTLLTLDLLFLRVSSMCTEIVFFDRFDIQTQWTNRKIYNQEWERVRLNLTESKNEDFLNGMGTNSRDLENPPGHQGRMAVLRTPNLFKTAKTKNLARARAFFIQFFSTI